MSNSTATVTPALPPESTQWLMRNSCLPPCGFSSDGRLPPRWGETVVPALIGRRSRSQNHASRLNALQTMGGKNGNRMGQRGPGRIPHTSATRQEFRIIPENLREHLLPGWVSPSHWSAVPAISIAKTRARKKLVTSGRALRTRAHVRTEGKGHSLVDRASPRQIMSRVWKRPHRDV